MGFFLMLLNNAWSYFRNIFSWFSFKLQNPRSSPSSQSGKLNATANMFTAIIIATGDTISRATNLKIKWPINDHRWCPAEWPNDLRSASFSRWGVTNSVESDEISCKVVAFKGVGSANTWGARNERETNNSAARKNMKPPSFIAAFLLQKNNSSSKV